MTSVFHTPSSDTDAGATSSRQHAFAIMLLIAVVMAAYCNCYNASFHFDDSSSIVDNMSIRRWSTMFSPPNANGETVSGRPLLNATFRINYAISGLDVWSYHAVNVLIHTLAGLALLGVVRRTLLLPCMRRWFDARGALWVAWLVAAIWVAHPMNTEAVTYIVQRAESFMALWYLLTLYCFIRSVENCADDVDGDKKPARNWMIASWLACLAGMASKEVMVSAPVMLFFHDRAFVAGSFKKAWQRRKFYYGAFALTWILLAALMLGTGHRGDTVGFAGGVSWWAYGFTQCWALVRYLWQAFWPGALIFDYGIDIISDFSKVWPQASIVTVLVVAAVVAFWRAPRIGWVSMLFFAILAPTTSVIPVVTQMAAEHRMYLPLAALVSLLVVCAYVKFGWRVFWAGGPLTVVLILLTVQRNYVYENTMTLWKDVVEKHPGSSRANSNYGYELILWSRLKEGMEYCLKGAALNPKNGDAFNNVGYAHASMGDYEKANEYYRQALKAGCSSADVVYNNVCFALYKLGKLDRAWLAGEAALKVNAHSAPTLVNMGNIRVAQQRRPEAVEYYKRALEINPKQADALNNWGNLFALEGNLNTALDYYKKAVEYAPRNVDALDNVARLLVVLGRISEAIPYFEAELALLDDLPEAHKNLAEALLGVDRLDGAVWHYREAVRLDEKLISAVNDVASNWIKAKRYSDIEKLYTAVLEVAFDSFAAYYNYGNALALQGRYEECTIQFREAVRCDPNHAGAWQNLGTILLQLGHAEDALAPLEAAVRLNPGLAPVRHNYAVALEQSGRLQEAIRQELEALRIRPGLKGAREHLNEMQDKACQLNIK
jgi:tetratricopeptide (TPR) repeat protein